jgi:hypothetical protein
MSHWQVVGSQSVQAITDRLYLAWEAFFRGDIEVRQILEHKIRFPIILSC